MPAYYVHIPDSEAPTAEVSASSTKHARTAYLDYLSRNNLIAWSERQSTRSLVRVSRMDPGEIRTQVQLDYDMTPEPEAVIEEVPTTDIDAGEFAATPSELQRHVEPFDEGEMTPEERAQLRASPGDREDPGPFAPYGSAEDRRKSEAAGIVSKPLPPKQVDSLANSPIAKLSRKSKGM